ncbi:MAG: hypothetical protein ACLRZJ_15500 [Mediterraneibacter gnavus]
MNDIFKDMQKKVGCEYISDLPSYKRKVWHEMKRLNPADYEERQLEDFSKYVFGMSYQTIWAIPLIAVKFLDIQTKATQVSQYELVLQKDSNWKIVG